MGLPQLILAGSLLILVDRPVSGEPASPSQAPPAATASPLGSAGKNPFARIFTGPDRAASAPHRSPEVNSRVETPPRGVCGMVVVPADPSTDRKILVRPIAAANTDYKIRRIAPEMCRE